RASAAIVPTDAGLLEVVDLGTQRTTATASTLEGPLAVVTGTARANINGRTMAVDPAGTTAYILTVSGLSIVPISGPTSAQNAPQLAGTPVTNSANLTAGLAPGGLISIFGKNLAANVNSSGTPLPTVLGGTCVTLNNAPIPL